MRLGTKLLLISELVLLVLVVVILIPVRNEMRQQVIGDLQNELRAIAATAALQIDGDVHHQAVLSGNPASAEFQAVRDVLMDVRVSNSPPEQPHLALSADNIYTFYSSESGGLRFGVMTQDPFLGDPYDVLPHQAMSLASGMPYASELYTDEYGNWISAVAPIRNSADEIVGLLEINRHAEAYFARYDNVVLLTTAIAVVGLLISSLLGYVVLRWLILRPVQQIHDGMEALGRHEFSHRVDIQSRDEFQKLADTLNNLFGQLNIARSIQSSFVPKQLPQSDQYSLACRSDPCDATGGDYIDAFKIDDERMAIIVADVTGHGLGPSLLMASCRSALRALASTGLGPGDLLERLEAQLINDLHDGRFITMIYGILEKDGTFTYANAGHGPAMIVSDQSVKHLAAHRTPLGIVFDVPKGQPSPFPERETTIQLNSGDRILFTSDGLSEAQDHGDEHFGTTRIAHIAGDSRITPDQVITGLHTAMVTHLDGREVNDDVTMLCVDRV